MKKLRNKKTGEIGELQITEKHYAVVVGNGTANCNAKIYCSLDKLNEEWEDAPEEPEEYWWIDASSMYMVRKLLSTCGNIDKEIGNYFETEEEAEKAVEKLKAGKRLKDKGLRFVGWDTALRRQEPCDFVIFCDFDGLVESEKDLDLLFGGEE